MNPCFRSDYNAFWKCATAGLLYMCTQLLKMLFLATFFPAGEMDEEEDIEGDQEVPFVFFVVSQE